MKNIRLRLERDMLPDNTPTGKFLIDIIVFTQNDKSPKVIDELFEMKLSFEIEMEGK